MPGQCVFRKHKINRVSIILSKLGIIAGGDALPGKIINHCRATGRSHFVLAFHGQTDPQTVEGTEHAWVHVGAVGKAISAMKNAGATELVMAGKLRRPSWTELRPDALGAKWMARIAGKSLGDDGLLRLIAQELEKEGFRIIGAEDLIGKTILASQGVLGAIQPDEQSTHDIARGIEVALSLGKLDVGQAVIVQQGIVLGVEAIEGTGALITRCQGLHRKGEGGVLIKIAKPGQDRRFDLPTIGVDTVSRAHKAGLRGVAIESDSVQIMHMEDVIKLADELGLFIEGIEVSHECQGS